jgi:hypothetical protein
LQQTGSATAVRRIPEFFIHKTIQVGKYLVSPWTRSTEGGRFAAIVSIRSGTGSMTHDRVMRFSPIFDTSAEARRFATDQALAWIGQPSPENPRNLSLQG